MASKKLRGDDEVVLHHYARVHSLIHSLTRCRALGLRDPLPGSRGYGRPLLKGICWAGSSRSRWGGAGASCNNSSGSRKGVVPSTHGVHSRSAPGRPLPVAEGTPPESPGGVTAEGDVAWLLVVVVVVVEKDRLVFHTHTY
ncbi:hypothetical protein E2C01_035685 [Portunus trituberculatus]|uniref:Uncharacterized protein n=1 Tax=Portunus trituberculatus TaxID=210409 RepID=A0A5B7F4Y1_PORTR|nr:hypothetical protein [Portunus trituberculatus]